MAIKSTKTYGKYRVSTNPAQQFGVDFKEKF